MDPKICLIEGLAMVVIGDLDGARARLRDYRDWRARGGFEPAFAGEKMGDDVALALACRIDAAQAKQHERELT
jgi:hypothetical protein